MTMICPNSKFHTEFLVIADVVQKAVVTSEGTHIKSEDVISRTVRDNSSWICMCCGAYAVEGEPAAFRCEFYMDNDEIIVQASLYNKEVPRAWEYKVFLYDCGEYKPIGKDDPFIDQYRDNLLRLAEEKWSRVNG